MTEEAGPPQRPPSGGIVPLRPLDAGQIVGGALRFVRRVPAAVLPGLLLAVVVVGGLALQQLVLGPQQPSNPFDLVGTFLESMIPSLPFALLLAAVTPLGLAVLLPAVTRAIHGRPTR